MTKSKARINSGNLRHYLIAGAAGLAITTSAHAQFSCTAPEITQFDAATWNSTTANAVVQIKATHNGNIQAALDAENPAQIDVAISTYISDLVTSGGSTYVSYFEKAPEVAGALNIGDPNLSAVTSRWTTFANDFTSQMPWQFTNLWLADAVGNPERLRNHSRYGRAFAQSYESGLGSSYGSEASTAFNYITSTQGTGNLLDGTNNPDGAGLFGVPYAPGASPSSLAGQVAAAVDDYVATTGNEVRESKTYVKNFFQRVKTEWVTIDFVNGGDFYLDNGEAGAALLYGSEVGGSSTWLNSGLASADWAKGRRLVTNWNYNAMNGYLLSRAYRLTGDASYLTEAKRVMDLGVFPAQYQTGRWVDPHNARPQYHGIILSAVVEYYLALMQNGGADATYANGEVKDRLECALDNISAEVTAYGAVNPNELLYLDALVFAQRIFGANQDWEDAANLVINFATNEIPFSSELPAPVMSWILSERDLAGTTVPGFEWTVLP